MNKTNDDTIINILITTVICLMAFIPACHALREASTHDEDTVEAFRNAVDVYKETPSEQHGKSLVNSYEPGLFVYAPDKEALAKEYNNIMIEAQHALIDNEDIDLLLTLTRSGRGLKSSAADKLSKVYKGNSARIYSLIGNRKLELEQPVAAYEFYVKAALLNNDFYYYPRGLAYNYGCTDLYNIWGAYGASKRDLDGSRYPMTPATLSTEELVSARNQLLEGQLPSFAKDCALNYLK